MCTEESWIRCHLKFFPALWFSFYGLELKFIPVKWFEKYCILFSLLHEVRFLRKVIYTWKQKKSVIVLHCFLRFKLFYLLLEILCCPCLLKNVCFLTQISETPTKEGPKLNTIILNSQKNKRYHKIISRYIRFQVKKGLSFESIKQKQTTKAVILKYKEWYWSCFADH